MKLVPALAVSALLVGVSISANADQQQNAYAYVFWKTSTTATYTSLQQRIQVSQKSSYTFWANSWAWSGASDGGYIGLQTNGNRVDGSVGDTAIFSIWNATAANGNCQAFGGEGTGYSCRLAYTIDTTHSYNFRVAKGSSGTGGQWWNAYVKDVTTGTESMIGSIRANASSTSMQLPTNFSEYFGPTVATCNDVPVSIVYWYQPSLMPVNSYLSVTPTYSNYSLGSCTGGSVQSTTLNYFYPVVKVTLGGSR